MDKSVTTLLCDSPSCYAVVDVRLQGMFPSSLSGEQYLNILEDAKSLGVRWVGEGRARTAAVPLDNLSGVWRKNHHGGLFRNIFKANFLNSRRVIDEVSVSKQLYSLGIATPPVLFALAFRKGIFFEQHIVTEEVANSSTLFDSREDEEAMHSAGKLLRTLFDIGFDCPDLHPANMLWQNEDKRIWIIDLVGASIRSQPLSQSLRARKLARFERFFIKHGGALPSSIAAVRALQK